MDKELQEKLFTKYPNLYVQRLAGVAKSPMAWGISTGPGWYELIDTLSQRITDILNNKDCFITCEAVQVKEKFGGLRFYVDIESKNNSNTIMDLFYKTEIYRIISACEEESFEICDICGGKGQLSNIEGWYATRCEKHRKIKSI